VEASTSLVTAFAAGLLSVLSPCVLPLLPAYLSLVSGVSVEELRTQASERDVRRRVMGTSLAFVLGFSAVFVVLGASATLLGRVLRSFRLELLGTEIGVAQIGAYQHRAGQVGTAQVGARKIAVAQVGFREFGAL